MNNVPTIAAFGDSLFQGWGLDHGQDAPTILTRLLGESGHTIQMLNFGVSGDTAGDGLRRLNRVRAAKPDLALLEFGANDFYQGVAPEQMEEQLATIITALMEDGIKVIVVGIRCLSEYTGEEYAARFTPVHAKLAQQFGLPLLPDIFAAYLHRPELLQPDGIHPNVQGAEAIARYLLPVVIAGLDGLRQST